MSTRLIHFPQELRLALARLDLTQQQFSESAGVSVALLTKIFRGEPVHRKSLKLIIDYFRTSSDLEDEREAKEIVARLLAAYYRDVLDQLGIDANEQEEIDLRPDLVSAKDRAIINLFRTMPGDTLLAFYSLGTAMQRNPGFADAVFALADHANALANGPFSSHEFRAKIHVPSRRKQLYGGTLGELMRDLNS